MKIVSKVERKGNKVKVTFSDSTSISFSQEIFKNFPLSPGQSIEPQIFELLQKENEYFEIKKSALRFLSIRNHSYKELERKLIKKKFNREIVHKVLNELIELKYLNDYSFAEQFYTELKNKFFGPLKIKNEMIKRGIDREIVEEITRDYFNDDDLQKQNILELLNKTKFPKKISSKQELQKIYNHLINRGFSHQPVMQVLREKFNLDDD